MIIFLFKKKKKACTDQNQIYAVNNCYLYILTDFMFICRKSRPTLKSSQKQKFKFARVAAALFVFLQAFWTAVNFWDRQQSVFLVYSGKLWRKEKFRPTFLLKAWECRSLWTLRAHGQQCETRCKCKRVMTYTRHRHGALQHTTRSLPLTSVIRMCGEFHPVS